MMRLLPFLRPKLLAVAIAMLLSSIVTTEVTAGTIVTIGQLRYDLNNSSAFTDDPCSAEVLGLAEGVSEVNDLVIPDAVTYNGVVYPVTVINNGAFWGLGINGTLTLGNSLVVIWENAFRSCQFHGDIIIPDAVRYIGDYAFSESGCNNSGYSEPNPVRNVIVGNSVEEIGDYAFNAINFESLYLPASLTKIGAMAFYDNSNLMSIRCDAVQAPINGEWIYPSFDYNAKQQAQYNAAFYDTYWDWKDFYYWNVIRIDETGITGVELDKSDATVYVGETVQLTANVLPDEGVDQNVSWSSSDYSVATVDGNGVVTGKSVGYVTIKVSTINYKTASCNVEVKSKLNPSTGLSEAIELSAEKIREGGRLRVGVDEPTGGYAGGWAYRWTSGGETVSTAPTFAQIMTMEPGEEPEIANRSYRLVLTNSDGNGTVTTRAEYLSDPVAVYRRPVTPVQLVRKGDGTSRTLVVMMSQDDTRLNRMGYTFVYGYTDAAGGEHVVATTTRRYCRMDLPAYDDASCRKWVYAQWTYADGSVVTSGRRYMDGTADEEFDGSVFSGSPKAVMTDYSLADNWIRVDGGSVELAVDAEEPARVDIHTVSGICVKTMEVEAGAALRERIGAGVLPGGIYIVSVSSGAERVVKKVVIR